MIREGHRSAGQSLSHSDLKIDRHLPTLATSLHARSVDLSL